MNQKVSNFSLLYHEVLCSWQTRKSPTTNYCATISCSREVPRIPTTVLCDFAFNFLHMFRKVLSYSCAMRSCFLPMLMTYPKVSNHQILCYEVLFLTVFLVNQAVFGTHICAVRFCHCLSFKWTRREVSNYSFQCYAMRYLFCVFDGPGKSYVVLPPWHLRWTKKSFRGYEYEIIHFIFVLFFAMESRAHILGSWKNPPNRQKINCSFNCLFL